MSVFDNIAFGLKMRKVPVARLDEQGNQIIAIDNHMTI